MRMGLEKLFCQARERNKRRHERATRTLPQHDALELALPGGREALLVRRAYTDAALNEHMVAILLRTRSRLTGRWVERAKIVFSTTDWVNFCRGLRPRFQPVTSFTVPHSPGRKYYWFYEITVGNRVRLSQKYVSVDADPMLRRLYRKEDRNICVSSELWSMLRDKLRPSPPEAVTL